MPSISPQTRYEVARLSLTTLETLEHMLSRAIGITPTSPERNLLAETNLHLMMAKEKLLAAMKETLDKCEQAA